MARHADREGAGEAAHDRTPRNADENPTDQKCARGLRPAQAFVAPGARAFSCAARHRSPHQRDREHGRGPEKRATVDGCHDR